MATLSTNSNNTKFAGTFAIYKLNGSILNLSTADKYVDKNIEITLNVDPATIVAGSASISMNTSSVSNNTNSTNIIGSLGSISPTEPSTGYYIAITGTGTGNSSVTHPGWINQITLPSATTTATNYLPITAAQGNITFTDLQASCSLSSNTNVIVSDTDEFTNNIKVTFSSSGSALAHSNITTAGYAPAGQLAETRSTAATATTTKFIKGVTLNKPSSGESKFSITVPNGEGNDTITFVFHVDSSGNVTIDDGTNT